jgi:large subunit ribosomal protein L25
LKLSLTKISMQKHKLKAEKREIVGKKVKRVRKEGKLPVGLFGKDVKSEALMVPIKEFMMLYAKVGETGLIELDYGDKTQHVLVSNLQIHPLTRQALHAELHAVKLTDKIKAAVPVHLTGESPAVKDGVGVILQTLNEVEVEALPTDLPEAIIADVSAFSEVGQLIKVSDLVAPKGVVILTDGEETVVNVGSAVSEETAKELAADEAAKAATPSEGATPEETPAAEGETKASEGQEKTS